MSVLGPGGSMAAAKANEKTKTTQGKGSGAGTNAILGAHPFAPGASAAAANTPHGKATDTAVRASSGTPGGATNGAPTITRTAPTAALPPGATATPSSADTYDSTGRLKYQGTSPYVADPSAGQIVGALTGVAPVAGTLNTVAGAATAAMRGKGFDDTYDGGLVGRAIDAFDGSQPGPVSGYTGNRVASSTNSRGDRPSDDSRLADRAGAAATAALTGDQPDQGATGAAFSDILLSDRRKPKSPMAGTDLLLKAFA